MSKRLCTTLHSARRCEVHYLRRCASPQALSSIDDPRPLLPRSHRQRTDYHPNRSFSSTQPWRAAAVRAARAAAKQPPQASMNVQMQRARDQAIRDGQIPDDLGLVPNTFIMPRAEKRPNWFTNYKDRMRLEKKRLSVRWEELRAALGYRYWLVKPRPRLSLSKISTVAKELQKEMYTNFASGNLSSVESKICSGLLGSLRRRISLRPANTRLIWRLHTYLSPPKLVSYKAAVLPQELTKSKKREHGLVQAVVRIHSLQSLQHVQSVTRKDRNGQTSTRDVIVDETGPHEYTIEQAYVPANAKESIEYLVVQRSLRKSKEGPWMVWGTAEETTIDKLDREGNGSKRAQTASAV